MKRIKAKANSLAIMAIMAIFLNHGRKLKARRARKTVEAKAFTAEGGERSLQLAGTDKKVVFFDYSTAPEEGGPATGYPEGSHPSRASFFPIDYYQKVITLNHCCPK